jgi:UDP-N-acetylmuramate--alanine ligase
MKPSIRLSRLHFIGIGGSGMSVLAEVLTAWGFRVSGSDAQAGAALERLKTLGMRVEKGHRAANVGEADVVVYSSAVPNDNPELEEARRRGIPTIKRAEMLGEALRGKYPLAVSGTHGKTTTTTMLGRIWLQAGKDPTLLAGGTARGENLSAVAGEGQVLIVEADEFDRSFLAMRPACAIIGNIDSDHLDCYLNLAAIREAFIAFAESLPFYGLVVANRDDAGVQAILPRLTRRIATYGLSAQADYRAVDIRIEGQGMEFALVHKGVTLGHLTLKVPGIHNVYNALGAAALSLEEGLTFQQVESGLGEYPGVQRRLEFRGEKSGVKFYDDYAHHPTEVAAALQAARGLITARPGESGRLIAVFQPHLYSRTQQLHREFARAFAACDELFVTRVYAAREKPIAGVEGDLIAAEARNGSLAPDKVHYVDDLETLPQLVAAKLRAGDLLMTMGAGDIGQRGAGIQAALP